MLEDFIGFAKALLLQLLSVGCRFIECNPLPSGSMRDASLTQQFGLLIRHLRQESGLSQEAFAERCGLHRTYIGAIERGEKTVTIETARKLAHALTLPLSQLFLQLEAQEAQRPSDL